MTGTAFPFPENERAHTIRASRVSLQINYVQIVVVSGDLHAINRLAVNRDHQSGRVCVCPFVNDNRNALRTE
jgi:hypothetical protein